MSAYDTIINTDQAVLNLEKHHMTNVNDENENSLNSTEQTVINENDNTHEETQGADDVDALKEQNKRLFERAKQAEAEKKAMKAERDALVNNPSKAISKTSADVSAEELRLIARGLSDEEIDKAKVIAKGLGISLPDALKDEMFLSYQNKKKEDARKEKAKLGASKGSGQSDNEPSFKEGMSPDEHKALWKKQNGFE